MFEDCLALFLPIGEASSFHWWILAGTRQRNGMSYAQNVIIVASWISTVLVPLTKISKIDNPSGTLIRRCRLQSTSIKMLFFPASQLFNPMILMWLSNVNDWLIGGRVILACRSVERGEAAAGYIRKTTRAPANSITVMKLDLSSFQSVRDFVTAFKKSKFNIFTCELMQSSKFLLRTLWERHILHSWSHF